MRFSAALATICLLAEMLFLAAIGRVFHVFLGIVLVIGLVNFMIGKSTKVPLDSLGMRSRRLSHQEFDSWAQMVLRISNPQRLGAVDMYRSSPLSYWRSTARFHVFAPRWVIVFAVPMIAMCALWLSSPDWVETTRKLTSHTPTESAIILGVCFGLTVGMPAGWLWRWLRLRVSSPAASRHPQM